MGLLVEVAPAARLHRDSSTCGAVAIALGCARLSSRDRPGKLCSIFQLQHTLRLRVITNHVEHHGKTRPTQAPKVTS